MEEEKTGRVKRKYIKWTLGLDRNTPKYLIIEETKLEETRDKGGKSSTKRRQEHRRKVS